MKQIFKISLIISLLFLFISGCIEKESLVTVSYVIDGDTIVLENGDKIRLIGVDAPEIHESTKPVGEFAWEAKKFVEDFLKSNGWKISLEFDEEKYDYYGRTLAYVYGKDGMLNDLLLQNGLARPLFYESTSRYIDKFVSSYKNAFLNRKGIFTKYDSAQILTPDEKNIQDFLGKIVWLKIRVDSISKDQYGNYEIIGTWNNKKAFIKIRREEYEYIFLPENYNIYSLKNKTVKFFGELWWSFYKNMPMILIRAPFEIKIIQ